MIGGHVLGHALGRADREDLCGHFIRKLAGTDLDQFDAVDGIGGTPNQYGLDDTARLERRDRLTRTRVGRFRKQDAATMRRRARVQRFQECHEVASLARSAVAIVGCTRSLTSPP